MLGTVCTTIRVCDGSPEFWSLHRNRLLYFSIVLNRMVNLEQIEQVELLLTRRNCSATVLIRVEIDSMVNVTFNTRSISGKTPLSWRVKSSVNRTKVHPQ